LARDFLRDSYVPIDLGLDWFTPPCAAQAADWLLDDLVRPAYRDSSLLAADFLTDLWFTAFAELVGSSPGIFRYVFDQPVRADTLLPAGTCHCDELPYVLGFDGFQWDDDTPDQVAIAASFARPAPEMRAVHDRVAAAWLAFATDPDDLGGFVPSSGDFGEPHSLWANGSLSTVEDAPVHSPAARRLTRDFFCDHDAIRAEVLRRSACADDDPGRREPPPPAFLQASAS